MSILSETMREQLTERVLSFIGMGPDPGLLAELAGVDARRLAPPGGGPRVTEWLVRFALGRADPALFIRIVTRADFAGMHRELHDLVAALQADPARWGGADLEDLWVLEPPLKPFIDRTDLRAVLLGMAGGAGPAALTIDAPGGHGKRTVCNYVRQLAVRMETFVPVIERELRAEPMPGLLDRIVFDLSVALGIVERSTTMHEDPDRIARERASDLALGILLAAPTPPVWLVVNLVDAPLEAGVVPFLDEMLRLVHIDPELSSRIRLILLTDRFTRYALENLPPPGHRHTLPQVSAADIGSWLADAVPGQSEGRYRAAIQSVLDDLARRQVVESRRMEWLGRLSAVAHSNLARSP